MIYRRARASMNTRGTIQANTNNLEGHTGKIKLSSFSLASVTPLVSVTFGDFLICATKVEEVL